MPKSTRASKNSKTPPASKKKPGGSRAAAAGWQGIAAALVLSCVVCVAALWWFSARGYLLYYGDAVAHLNIARRLFDSRTPGYEQIGTVWLPLPHWIMAWFAHDRAWWSNGLAGGIPAAIAQAFAAVFLFASLRRALSCTTAALVGMLLFLLNPNSAYLGSLPMTEPFFAFAFCALVWFTISGSAAGAGIAACAATLIRYDGWFLLPFVALYFLVTAGWRRAALFSALAGAGPLYWLWHNWAYFGDPLEFYWGPYSAKAINQRAVDAGMARYPGDHAWLPAWRQFRAAAELVAGLPLAMIGVVGFAALLWRRAWALAALLLLPPLFYWLSIYSSGTPIFVPHLEPFSYYNTRYGLAALPLLAAGAAAIVSVTPGRARAIVAPAVLIAGLSWWIFFPRADAWICWKESQVNSEARRAWTGEAAEYLRAHYDGGGILTSFGDLAGIFQQAGIPMVQTVHEGNGPLWFAQVYGKPEFFLHQRWVLTRSGDAIGDMVVRARLRGPRYELVKSIAVKDAPVLEIYKLVERFPKR